MSQLYECVVVCGPGDQVREAFEGLETPRSLGLAAVAEDVWAVYVRAGRDVPFDLPEDEKIARTLSGRLGKALLVLYDDRCGLRHSALYEAGDMVRTFGEEDEIWVALDEQGQPDLDGARYRWEEIRDDVDGEYETLVNAIDAGLKAFGVPSLVDSRRPRKIFCDRLD